MHFRRISKLIINYIVTTAIFWINDSPPSKYGLVLSNTKAPGQIVLITLVDYKNIFHLQTVEYVQVHQQDESQKTIDIDRTFGEIVLDPQNNLQDGYLSEILQTEKHLRRLPCTPANMTEGVIERYDTFTTKGFLYELHFGGFRDQPIPLDYYDLLNDKDDYNNNIHVTPVDNFFP